MQGLTVFAPAKVNLTLHITGRRDDGYHVLESLIVFADWGDTLTLTPASEPSLTMTGPAAGGLDSALLNTGRDSPNLVVRALYAMADAAGRPPAMHIHLDKHIPTGAGLGGGSSDAAAVMIGLNTLLNAGFSMDDLCSIGTALGAELPVCLYRRAVRVSGIGEILEPWATPALHMLIAWPETPLLTADVFRTYRDMHTPFDPPLWAVTGGGFRFDKLYNGLTPAAHALCPAIGPLIDQITATPGCLYAGMSGSGSACFGLFPDAGAAARAAMAIPRAVPCGLFNGDGTVAPIPGPEASG